MEAQNAFFNINSISFLDIESKKEIKTYVVNLRPGRSPVVIPRIGEKISFYKKNNTTIKFNNSYIVRDIVHNYVMQPASKEPEVIDFDYISIIVYCEKCKEVI